MNCGDCLPGFMEDPDDPDSACIGIISTSTNSNIESSFNHADIDECANATKHHWKNPCGRKGKCTNTEGSFTCSCAKGYMWNGRECISECIVGKNCSMYSLHVHLLLIMLFSLCFSHTRSLLHHTPEAVASPAILLEKTVVQAALLALLASSHIDQYHAQPWLDCTPSDTDNEWTHCVY